MKIYALLGFLCALISFNAEGKTSIWKIEKDDKVAYIGGTVHLLRASDFPIPKAYDQAYADSDVLVFEVDMDEMAGAAFKMAYLGSYQDGTTLKDHLSPEVYQKFEKFCKEQKVPIDSLLTLKPTMASLQIVMGKMLQAGATPEGVDMIYTKRAISDGKKRLALESVDDQINALFHDKVDADQIILTTMRDAAKADEMLDNMVSWLFEGKVELFNKEMLEPMKKETPEYYKSLIEVRNNNWMPKVEAMIATPEREFILVGGLHLVGDIGVIKQLKAKGYKVTQLD
ncbi:TraB/GumN family protein [Pleionea sediminis]|uniref:TraB/GumN family protein n=1 Tax=Pleionea sediminis TaxID=2569479 RepID=UPI0013DD9B4A|nr:TraB/GumN family protein [Pleionea sediminis]